jgi:transposase-like protein
LRIATLLHKEKPMTQYNSEERTAHLNEWEKSGKSVMEYCRENNIRSTTFYGWTKHSRKKKSQKEIPFVELKSKPRMRPPQNIILEKNDLKIHIPADLSTADLKPLLKLLGLIL